MTFSSQVKNELVAQIGSSRHCRFAELAALVSMSGQVKENVWYPDSENSFLKDRIQKLSNLLKCDVNDEQSRLSMKLSTDVEGFVVDPMLVERSCCKQAFVRGAFLATGSVTDPNKGYHFEIVCNYKQQADMILRIIESFGLNPKQIERKKYYVVYMKDGSNIVDILNIMGAHVSLMDMENVRILKDMRNHVNRRVNCEAANINKTVNAAQKQVNDILFIEQTKGLSYLPAHLREIASVRVEQPDMPLKELGECLNPPLGKSGVNHRLRKISEIASDLRRNEYNG